MARQRKFFEAVNEALDQCMTADPNVYVMGLGVPDPKGIFGTTLGLQAKHGAQRVMDMPTSENGMTGVAIGSALVGMRPVMVHQRFDFALLALEQIVNQAAKWSYLFAGQRVPITIRLIVGRGWGQGPQHSQSLHAWLAHVPGLKVAMPATPSDAKGLLVAAIEDNNPVVVIEHRWLHQTFGHVPEEKYSVPLGQARVARAGSDITIVAVSHMVIEALRAADMLAPHGIDVEVIDLRTAAPLDRDAIVASVQKTGRLIAADIGWTSYGLAGEVIATAVERAFGSLKAPPKRIAMPDTPVPTTPALSRYCYPTAWELAAAAAELCGLRSIALPARPPTELHDVPDASFSGPF